MRKATAEIQRDVIKKLQFLMKFYLYNYYCIYKISMVAELNHRLNQMENSISSQSKHQLFLLVHLWILTKFHPTIVYTQCFNSCHDDLFVVSHELKRSSDPGTREIVTTSDSLSSSTTTTLYKCTKKSPRVSWNKQKKKFKAFQFAFQHPEKNPLEMISQERWCVCSLCLCWTLHKKTSDSYLWCETSWMREREKKWNTQTFFLL